MEGLRVNDVEAKILRRQLDRFQEELSELFPESDGFLMIDDPVEYKTDSHKNKEGENHGH